MLGNSRTCWGVALLIAIAGCGAHDLGDSDPLGTPPDALGGPPAPPPPPGPPPFPLPGPHLRWIGKAPTSAPCPKPGDNWSRSRLIDDPLDHAPDSLRQYCVYEWTGTSPPPDPPVGLPNKGAILPKNWLDEDPFDNAMQSDASKVEDIVFPVLQAAHLAQVEQAPPPAASAGTAVDVAILDTWASFANQGRSTHGLGMAGIVDRIACGGVVPALCPIKTSPHLALDRYGASAIRDTVHGGNYGSPGAVARAMFDAIPAPGSTGPKHVFNLSLGWDGRYNPSTASPGSDSYAVQAVREVLEYAACQGVLVIAAAGNDTGGPDPGSGPMYPGAFEKTAAPSYSPSCPGGTVVPRPLVYSVEAVDGTDRPVENARPGARSVLAAPGFAVPSAKTISSGPRTVPAHTGSSLASAVVSAIAARVWNFNPGLAPDEVMAVIQNSAQVLPNDLADYCLSGSCGNVLRVSACRALKLAGAGVSCNAPIGAYAGTNGSYASVLGDIDAVPHEYGDGSNLLSPQQPYPCTKPTESISGLGLGPENLCPYEYLTSYLMAPATGPEGEFTPCGACGYYAPPGANETVLEMAISDKVTAPAVYPQTLTLRLGREIVEQIDLGSASDNSSGTVVYLRDGLTPGKAYKVTLPPPKATAFDGASIEWTKDTDFTSSVIVITR